MAEPVRIVKLEPMLYFSAYGFGISPEADAWGRIMTYAAKKGIDIAQCRFFGFDNPPQSPDSPKYGYEQWMTTGGTVEPEGDIRCGYCPGGMFAVARCQGVGDIFPTWQMLVAWVEDSDYRMTNQQGLEECLTPALILKNPPDFEHLEFDLYLPIID